MRLLANFFSKTGIDFFSKCIGFITIPIIARALGPDGYGLFSYLFVILSYFGFFIDFGYFNYGINKLCEKIDSKIIIAKIVSLQIILALFSYAILIICAYFIFDSYEYVLLLIFSITFILQIFSIKYYYLADNKLSYNSFSDLIGQIVYAGLVFFLIAKFPSVLMLIVISIIQALSTSLLLFIPYYRKNKFDISLNLRTNLKTFKESYKLGLTSKAEAVTASFVILSIGFFLNDQSVGFYSASYKIYLVLLTVVQGLSYTLMPMLLRLVKDHRQDNYRKISLIFYSYLITGLVLFFITLFLAEEIILLVFGNTFLDAVELLKSFSFTILIWPVVMFISLIMLAFNKYNYILLTSVSSAVFSIIFSLILINISGISGAGLVLPLVGFVTILIGRYFLLKISQEENFPISDLFSFKDAYNELNNILKKTSHSCPK